MIHECLQYNYNNTEPCPGSHKNCSKQITCPSHLKHHCFVVWKNESSEVSLIGAGCNPPYDSSPNETCNTECIGSPKGPRFYCCCTGNLCNKSFRLPDALLVLPQSRQSQEVEVKISPEPDYSSSLWPLVPVVLIITIVIGSIYRYKRKLNDQSRSSDPGINPLDYILINGSYRDQADALQLTTLKQNGTPVVDNNNIDLLEVVGRGRFGEVRKAIIQGTTSEIAVKIIAPADHQSWLNEVQIYTFYRVKHQNVLNFIDAMEHVQTDSYWLVVEFAPNGSLYSFLKQNLLSWDSFRKIALGIVHGLSHLHEADVAHRDFKSKNVLLRRDLTPCITDFGVATILDNRSGSQIDQKKKFLQVGTPRYMAPEVLECSVTFTKASFTKIDVYALSLVLWELLSRCRFINWPLSQPAQVEFDIEYNNCNNIQNPSRPQPATGAVQLKTSNAVETTTNSHTDPLTDAPLPPQFLSSSSSSSNSSFGPSVPDLPCLIENVQVNGDSCLNGHLREVDIQKQQVDLRHQIAKFDETNISEPFKLPFQDLVGMNPDIETMRQVVVVEKLRPQIREHWRDAPTSIYCRAIEDGWEYDYDARISASCFVERLESLPAEVL